ncbi:putative disease resistance protein RGA3 [Panicum miliaceum]|uniref:Disease resistance protein RGA3 n=1 Tax=Panicum miliaceum TaxID=4540 RepID=A0A3L6Q6T0_PANMI|nr:putative disease resistance protein RGA3 [Panicum miliaceum]
MAAVLDALAPYVKKLITDMAEEEVSILLGVSSEITRLEDNMESLKAFLNDAERRRITDQSVQRWTRKVRDGMYEATDIIDLCQIEADKRRDSRGGNMEEKVPVRCLQPLLFCLRNPVYAHEIGSRIRELNQQLDGIRKGASEFSFNINLGSYPERRMLHDDAALSSASICKTRSQVDESAIVGEEIERGTKELVQVLTKDDNNHNIKVVSVIGTGGMGKTTLAQKIFNDSTIQEHFKTKVWLSITQHFDEAELLRTAIENAGRDHGRRHDKSTLTGTLIDTLSGGRFLLVMDDVWSEKAWNDVLSTPVRNASRKQPGSRVLVTTRSAHLPQQMQAPLHQHRVRPLGEDDAWSLLKKQLQPDQVVGIDEQLKNVGMEILKKCDGLPLAIKVIGGLLSTRFPSEGEWKAVLKSHAWSIAGLPPQLDNRIYLSYEDLSPQLKQCFLYCSLFSKGKDIFKNEVTHMWISEGYIQPPDGSSSTSSHEYGLEDIAAGYYRQLINRNLIEPAEAFSYTGNKCTMHDVVRSLAEYVAREESLVVDKEQAATSGTGMLVRRLSIGQTVSGVEWAVLQRQEALRTLIINSRVNFEPGDSLGSFSSLRVLYIIRSVNSDGLVASLTKLKHLRYLHLEDTDISRLPDDIHNMKFLLHIHLLYCKKLGHVPSSIIKLKHLRSLKITGSNVSVVPKGFGGLTNLRSLCGFPVHVDMDGSSSWCSLQELAPLSQLRELELDGLEKVPASWMAEKAMIGSKGHLIILSLSYRPTRGYIFGPGGEAVQQQQHSVMEKLHPPTCLETLTVDGGYSGRHLPNWMHAPASMDFKSLRYLKLVNLRCCSQLPNGLCRLPILEGLTIEDAPYIKNVGPEFQASSSFAAGDSAAIVAPFPKLRCLQWIRLCRWQVWEWNDNDSEEQGQTKAAIAMPCLELLYIKNCKLSCLPPGLANSKRPALRRLNLYELPNLISVENFPSVVELDVFECPKLKSISSLSMLQKVRISKCPKLEVFEGVPALDSLILINNTMFTLPGYLQDLLLNLYELPNLISVENFPSVVELDVFECPKLKIISSLSMLQKVRISKCPKLEVFEGVPALDSLILINNTMFTLPGYLQDVNPRYLGLYCHKSMHFAFSQLSHECYKTTHIPIVEYFEC